MGAPRSEKVKVWPNSGDPPARMVAVLERTLFPFNVDGVNSPDLSMIETNFVAESPS